MAKETITYWSRGAVERWSPSRRAYIWHDAYSAESANGEPLYPWMTRAECRADARAQGKRADFFPC